MSPRPLNPAPNETPGPASARAATPLLHLASRSPRRRRLLDECAIAYEAAPSPVDDSLLIAVSVRPHEWVASLAYLKAAAAAAGLRRTGATDRIVLGADTVVVKDERIIGQPRDAAHAKAIIAALRDGDHAVVTGVALLDLRDGARRIFADPAGVSLGWIEDDRIDDYLAGGGWRGKAGGYNLAERIDDGWPITFHGDPATIMGLPIRRLLPILEQLGIEPNHTGADTSQ